jgi:hypothetical protein
MQEEIRTLDEVVVVGYAAQRKQTYTASAVSTVRAYPPAKPEIGNRAYLKYIEKNLRYPADSTCATNLTGHVVLRFYVDSSGRPYDIEVAQNLCKSYDEEAIRLIKEGGKWKHSDKQVEYSVEFKKRK